MENSSSPVEPVEKSFTPEVSSQILSKLQKSPSKAFLVIVGILLLLLAGTLGYLLGMGRFSQESRPQSPSAKFYPTIAPTKSVENKACTMEAKICPDGTAVGRTGPNCEFAECPVTYKESVNGEKYVSSSQKISFDVPAGWRIKSEKPFDGGVIAEIQGPKQVMKVFENTKPDHSFDGFTTEKITVEIQGKSFSATKWTSTGWKNSFIEVPIQEEPYMVYVQYGDAASVGFQGYNQEYKEKVDFQSDIKPIEEILKTFQY